MKYHFKTTEGLYLARTAGWLYYLTERVDDAEEFDCELAASMAFLQLPKGCRQGKSGGPVPVPLKLGPQGVTAEEMEAAKIFKACGDLIDGATATIGKALAEMMESYKALTERIVEENAELRYRLESLEK